ncbi:hypothetical protein Tco_0377760 [Tanacetum coccineum]
MISPTMTSQIPRKSKGLSELSMSPERTTGSCGLNETPGHEKVHTNDKRKLVSNIIQQSQVGVSIETRKITSIQLDVLSRSGSEAISQSKTDPVSMSTVHGEHSLCVDDERSINISKSQWRTWWRRWWISRWRPPEKKVDMTVETTREDGGKEVHR